MLLRTLGLALLGSLLATPVAAQITLQAAESNIYNVDSGHGVSYGNEGPVDELAVSAILARSGADQTWDFTTLDLEHDPDFDVAVQRRTGSVGPGAGGDYSPLEQATATYVLTFGEDPGTTEEGIYGYYRLGAEGLYWLGALWYGEYDGELMVLLGTVNQPTGVLEAPPSYTFGSTWGATFTEVENGRGPIDVDATYEVDGWGAVRVPGVPGPVPALRVKVTREFVGTEDPPDVYYEFRTRGGVNVRVDPSETPGSPFDPGTQVEVAIVSGSGGTAVADRTSGDGYALGAPRPNPAQGRVALDVLAPTASVATVALYDVLGRHVLGPTPTALGAGGGPVTVDTGRLPAGAYVVRVDIGGQTLTRPLTVVR